METARTRRRLGSALAVMGAMAGAGAATFLVLHSYAAAASHGGIRPALAPNAAPAAPATGHQVVPDLLAFVPVGANEAIGAALRDATGYPPGARLPARFDVAPDGRAWHITVRVPVNVRRLLATGEITTGPWPGASNLATGQLAVSTNNAIYGVDMNPRTHMAVFQFLLARSDQALWALNWNALGVVSQSASLQ